MRLNQGLHPLGRLVETPRQKGHLVLPGLVDAGGQIAFTPLLYPVLQPFQPPRQLARDRVGGQGHRHRHQHQRPKKAEGRAVPGGRDWSRHVHVHGLAILHAHHKFRAIAKLAARPGHAPCEFGLVLALGFQRPALGLGGTTHHARTAVANDLARLIAQHDLAQRRFGRQPPGPTDQQGEHRHCQHHRQPDPHIQLFEEHAQSCCRANT